MNGVVLKPLPFPHPDELITVNHAAPGVNLPETGSTSRASCGGDPRLAIGKEITPNLKDPWREVVGVVGDERSDGMHEKAPPIA